MKTIIDGVERTEWDRFVTSHEEANFLQYEISKYYYTSI